MNRREWVLFAMLAAALAATAAAVLSHTAPVVPANEAEQEKLLAAWKNGVSTMVREHRYREAVPTLRNYLRYAPADNDVRRLLGKVLFEIRRYAEAGDVYYVALLNDPNDCISRNNLGVLFALGRRWNDALRELREAFENSGQELFIGANLARCCELAGETNEARRVWHIVAEGTRRDGELPIPEDALMLVNPAASSTQKQPEAKP
jgi:Flp pilus assembly protein TadD